MIKAKVTFLCPIYWDILEKTLFLKIMVNLFKPALSYGQIDYILIIKPQLLFFIVLVVICFCCNNITLHKLHFRAYVHRGAGNTTNMSFGPKCRQARVRTKQEVQRNQTNPRWLRKNTKGQSPGNRGETPGMLAGRFTQNWQRQREAHRLKTERWNESGRGRQSGGQKRQEL